MQQSAPTSNQSKELELQKRCEALQGLCEEMVKALKANGIFHTPIARRQLNGWNEYQQDAIDRTRDCLNTAASIGVY